ncbi:TonB-dependent siderophore receptor [Acetobacter farinalis]|nr:TonB-dependent siderophore receptor [Acetobacter farinalis]
MVASIAQAQGATADAATYTGKEGPKRPVPLRKTPVQPHKARQPEAVEVHGTATPVFSGGALGSKREIDTPFSIRTVTSAEIQERQVKSLSRLLSQDASVVSNGDTYSFNAYSVTVRGVPLDDYNGYKINGAPLYMTTVELPLESFETVQLLKGASGYMYGFNAPGGIINYQTKKPTEKRTFEVDTGYSSGAVASEHIDTGGRVLNRVFGYRLNLTHEKGETYNGSHVERYSGSLGVDARITRNLLWTADAIYQDRKIRGLVQDFFIDPQSYPSTQLPDAISGHKDLNAYPGSMFTSHVLFLSTGLKWKISDSWKFRVYYSHSQDWRSYQSEWMSLNNRAGEYDSYLSTDPRSWSDYNQAQGIVEGSFHTGFVKHDLSLGATWQGLTKYLPTHSEYVNIGSQNMYAPIIPRPWAVNNDSPVYRNYRSDQVGLFLSDTVTFDKHWSLLAGVRYTNFQQNSYNKTDVKSTYKVNPVTPTVALLYHPVRNMTVYASYVQALENGGTVGDTYKNARQTLPPIRSDQVEVGAKVTRRTWELTGALYRITRGAQYANTDNYYVSNGTQVYQGFELNGHVTLPLGFVLTDSLGIEASKYKKTDPSIQGNTAEAIPTFQNMFTVTNTIPHVPGLSASAEVHYTGRMWGDATNLYHIPGYTLLNLRASYRTTLGKHRVTFRAELDNVANTHYWGVLASDYFFVGAPRTVYLNARFDL